jgi:hypothetical protein
MDYIVAYTLKNNEWADTFVDRWVVFRKENMQTIEDAASHYTELLKNDGGENGWHLYTISMAQVLMSTDYSESNKKTRFNLKKTK